MVIDYRTDGTADAQCPYKVEPKREGIDKVLILATGKTGMHLDAFKRELAELGVVIKVDRELPVMTGSFVGLDESTIREVYYHQRAIIELLNDGYVVVEPLIEGFNLDTNKIKSKMSKEECDWVDSNVAQL